MARGGYTDVDAILADETRVPVTFKVTATGLGRALDPGADEDDVLSGTKLELPLWMVRSLAQRGFVSIQTPGFYLERMRRRLRVGAAVEDLRAACPAFYDVAESLVRVHAEAAAKGVDSGSGPLDDTLPAFAMETFAARYRELLIKGHAKGEGALDAIALAQRLSVEENALFQAARASATAADRWRNSEASRVCPAKRKSALAGVPGGKS